MACTSVPAWLASGRCPHFADRSATKGQSELLGEVGEERLVMQVRFRLRDHSLDLVQLGQGNEDRRDVTERLMQAPGLGSSRPDPVRLEAIEDRVTCLVGHDVE